VAIADEETPAALEAEETEEIDSPISDEASSPAAVDPYGKEVRDRLAQQGRELADARRTIQSLATERTALTERLGSVETALEKDRKARQDAYLAALPPDQRLTAELNLIKQDNARLNQLIAGVGQPKPQQSAGTAESEEAARARKSREILNRIGTRFGVELTGDEPDLDWTDPQSFYESAVALAAVAKHSASQTVQAKEKPVATKKATEAAPISPKPVPAGAKAAKSGPESYEDVLRDTNSFKSPRARVAALRGMQAQVK
jgi:chromosome segregation ATPase